MGTFILAIADPHLTPRAPWGRTDDYLATQFRKWRWLFQQARDCGAAAIAIAGDVFDDPKGERIKRWFDTRLVALFRESPCPILHIRGNHDVLHDREESLAHHPLGVLEEARLLTPVGWPRHVVVGDVLVTGLDYRSEGPGVWLDQCRLNGYLRDLQDQTGSGFVLTLLHGFFDTISRPRLVDPTIGFDALMAIGADVVVHGHNHQFGASHQLGRTLVVGPGAFTRQTLAAVDVLRTPRVAILRFDGGGVEHEFVTVPHESGDVVFRVVEKAVIQARERADDAFTASLGHLRTASADLATVLERAQEGLDSSVRRRVADWLTQARSERSEPKLPETVSQISPQRFSISLNNEE